MDQNNTIVWFHQEMCGVTNWMPLPPAPALAPSPVDAVIESAYACDYCMHDCKDTRSFHGCSRFSGKRLFVHIIKR